MLAAGCTCPRPRVFPPEFPGVQATCHKCGRDAPTPVTASTWRIALAIAEVMVRDRYRGPSHGMSVRPPP